ncbi:GGDEF domain-containing protein [Allofournierella sp.]|uniref:GGDEF domain-containing protein n=1 Tax=Allofournierella sp. TaxID=1940256 RepID=UPI003AB64117
MLINLITAAAYFYFNWRYFALVTRVLGRPRMAKLPAVGVFFLNYILFYVCSVQEWTLLVNWGLFFAFQFAESLLYCKNGWRVPLFLSIAGVQCGLTINIFCRCAVAIATDQPLAAFDNHVSAYGNLKGLPVFLGFVLGGAVLQLMALPAPLEKLRALIAHPTHLRFQLELMAGMFLYLFLNLLLYQSRSDSVFLKLWGIKSVIFSLVGSYLGLRYSLEMCRLSDYREQNRAIQRALAQSEREERKLRSAAYRDALTGTYSRQYALEQLDRLLGQNARFALCFVDLDDLKGVNDRHGHAQGDRYLVAAARELERFCRPEEDVLARFGGDEFLLLLPQTDEAAAAARLEGADRRLAELARSGEAGFAMSISYGVTCGGPGDAAEALLAAADERMYRQKRRKAGDRPGAAAK